MKIIFYDFSLMHVLSTEGLTSLLRRMIQHFSFTQTQLLSLQIFKLQREKIFLQVYILLLYSFVLFFSNDFLDSCDHTESLSSVSSASQTSLGEGVGNFMFQLNGKYNERNTLQ